MGSLRVDVGSASAEREEGMAERRGLWPLLVYGVLVAIAATRQAQTERTRANGNRKIDPSPDESEVPGESRPATQVDAHKRPREQFENDQPILAQLHRAKEPGRGRRATAPWHIPWTGWKDILWRVYASINDNRLLARICTAGWPMWLRRLSLRRIWLSKPIYAISIEPHSP